MDLEFYADYNASGHFPAQTCLKSMSARKNKVPKQIKFQLDLPTRGDLMGSDSGGSGLILPENIKREIPDDPCLPSGPRSLGSMQKVPSLSDLSEESSLGESLVSSILLLSLFRSPRRFALSRSALLFLALSKWRRMPLVHWSIGRWDCRRFALGR